jgi:UDP-N-acetyl-D-galactosamine dehydrogenase
MNIKIKIGIVGLGYVGLPLFIEFLKKKIDVVGFDISKSRINLLKKKKDYTKQSKKNEINLIKKELISNNDKILKKCNFFIITVPTPITKKNSPDLSAVISATKIVCKYLKKNNYVVYESTFYPGLTEEVCIKLIQKLTKLKPIKSDNQKNLNGFFYGYSPERINPGDNKHTLKNTIKITSGGSPRSAKFINKIYKKICNAGTYQAETVTIAECAKIIENTQRDINIALVNEFSQIFSRMNINIYSVLNAARTKWNFLNFRPGLVGGHCIGVDPYYLTYKARKLGYQSKLTLAGRELNDNMHRFILSKFYKNLKNNYKKKRFKILIVGLSFKENINDFRNSRSIILANEILKNGHKLDVTDLNISIKDFKSTNNLNIIKKPKTNYYDGIILAVAHDNYKSLGKNYFISLLNNKFKGVIFDVKNMFNEKTFLSI